MIRPFQLIDWFELRRRPYARVVFYNEMTLAHAHRPVWFALRCALPLDADRHTLVYRDRGVRGYLQARCRPHRPEADLLYLDAQPLHPGERQPTDPDMWYRLLHDFVERMGARGIERIFAPLGTNSDATEIFRQLGFQSYAHRQVWRALTPDVAEGSALIALRPQARRDPYAIQRLYERVTPKLVQQAEMRNAHSWQLPLVRSARAGVRQQTWVLGRDGRDDELRAAVLLWQGERAAVLRLLIDPAERQLVPAILGFGLTHISSTHQGIVYLLLPEYHGELGGDVAAAGFECLGDQVLMVKSTVVPIRKPLLRPVLEGGLEMVARTSVSSSVVCAEHE